MSKTWVNGVNTNKVTTTDRGFSYGDGIFTTIKVTGGQCQLMTQHLVRLQQGISALSIAQIDFKDLLDDLTAIASELCDGVIKVVITRGEGTRGYSSVGCDRPTLVISTSALPSHYKQWQQEGVALGVSTIALGLNPLTAGLKHLNRLEQVLVKQQIDENKWTDAVVLDCQACVIETSMANLFWRQGDVVYTPNLDFSGVKGLMRHQIISILKDNEVKVVEDRFKLSSIMNADEVFMSNCLMGIVPIVKIESTKFAIGECFNDLTMQLNVKDKR